MVQFESLNNRCSNTELILKIVCQVPEYNPDREYIQLPGPVVKFETTGPGDHGVIFHQNQFSMGSRVNHTT
jgi:hypothetical protein